MEEKTTEEARSNLTKMCEGDNYDAWDSELVGFRTIAKIQLRKYNHSEVQNEDERVAILKNLLGKVDEGIKIEAPFYCDYGFNIKVGRNFYMNFDCVILDGAEVEIGDNVKCGPKVQIYTACHPTDPIERLKGVEFAKKIKIGNNVWIGGGAIICPGVKIGDNTTIGAGSVVTKNIPNNAVAVGNPCKIIKYI
jgi:maltose O-acetyltransferase